MAEPAHPPLIQALLRPAAYRHPVRALRLVETHISWVILTGDYAYKVKKPLDLGFLDFSTLEKRRHYCNEELRLNRRLAPALYLDVVPIGGTPDHPAVAGPGPALEYAVRMRQFPEQARFDRMLERGALHAVHVEALARSLAEFHQGAAVADDALPYGTPESVYEPVRQNFDQINARADSAADARLTSLERWSRETFETLRAAFARRKRDGRVRECHGDVHLANVLWLQEHAQLFDCLEFNPGLRWIDVMNELAFLVMDLDDRGRPELARHARNAYLEHSGDYAGLEVLRFYQVYRALVRAKVARIRLDQEAPDGKPHQRTRAEFHGYLRLAERYTRASAPALLITHGLSGSGKTQATLPLLETLDAVRLRSDVERKRLHGLAPLTHSGSGIERGIYTAAASRRTYARLAELARSMLRSGYRVIVDATFLDAEPRHLMRTLAQELRVPFLILDFPVSPEVLRQRLRQRAQSRTEVSEADTAVLERQLTTHTPLTPEERDYTVAVAAPSGAPEPDFPARIRARLAAAAPD